jgi:hypothetical protein
MDHAHHRRNRRLRRRMLQALEAARSAPRGGLTGQALADILDAATAGDQRLENERHAIGLLRDLAGKGLIELEDVRRRSGLRFGLDMLMCRISPRGVSLLEEGIEPDPDVEDERNMGEEE